MATINDILDWLNQGAQGDIPGTGGSQPNAPQASQDLPATSQAGGGEAGAVTPGVFQSGAQPNPQDYSGGIPPTLLPHYQQLVQSGVPPMVAHHILTQSSMGEGEKASNNPWPYPYAGAQQEYAASQGTPDYQALWEQMNRKMAYDKMNLPTYEGDTPGDDDTFGLTRLPSGQYVPAQQGQQGGQKKGGLQGSPGYQAGNQGGTGILDMLFGKQPSQTIGDWLSGDQ